MPRLAFLALLALAACGAEGAPEAQTPATGVSMHGTASAGVAMERQTPAE